MTARAPWHLASAAAPAQPLFIVSSGRSGTQMLERLLADEPQVEAHHEFLCTHVQPLACRWATGQLPRAEALATLAAIYRPALAYSRAPLFADSSNKLSWLIELLAELFPQARFVHTVRDGRKVASSYFHKLADECYDDRSTAILSAWLDGHALAPPPEKKYYWPQPRPTDAEASRHFRSLDQFGRICWHWGEVNRRILAQLARVPSPQQFFCRLEDLVSDPQVADRLWRFIGLAPRPGVFEALQRPHNVNRPEDRLLDAGQTLRLQAEAGDMMARFGYHQRTEYRMQYGQPAPGQTARPAADAAAPTPAELST